MPTPLWIWAKSAGSNSGDYAGLDYGTSTISTDALGNSYITGLMNGPTTFVTSGAPIILTASVYPKIFVAKYDTNGFCLWAKQFGGNVPSSEDPYGNKGESIDIDLNGNCYVTGTFKATTGSNIVVGGTATLTGTGFRQIFLVKFDTNGNALWAKQPSAILSNNYANSVAVDYLGNAYIVGYLGQTGVQFGTTAALVGPGCYIAKYNAAGTVIYAKKIGLTGNLVPYSVAVDLGNSCYVTGFLQNTENFSSGAALTAVGTRDLFLIKIGTGGAIVFRKSFGYAGCTSLGRGISVDNYGKVYVTGNFRNKITLNGSGGTLTAGMNSTEAITAKFDSNGICLWARQSTGSMGTEGNSVKAAPLGGAFVAGHIISGETPGNPNVSFNSVILFSDGRRYTFVVKYDTNGNVVWAQQSGTTVNTAESPMGISYDANFNIYIAGNVQGAATFGTNTLVAYGSLDAFVAKLEATCP